MITITDDYNQQFDSQKYNIVQNYRRSLFDLKGFEKNDNCCIVDIRRLKLNKKEVEWIVNNSWKDVILLDEDLDKYKNLPDYVIIKKNKEKMTILDYMRLICYEKDREKVLSILKLEKPPVFVLFYWLLSNVGEIKCLNVLYYIDIFVLAKQSDNMFYSMVAFGIKPLKKGSIKFQYLLKRGETNVN